MDDLITEFISETVESLSELDMDLVKLEQDPQNADLLGKIFRLMHTIKGTCGFLGLSRLEKTAHAAENLLDLFRSGKMDISQVAMTVLFISIDRVRYLVSEVEANGAEPEGNDQDVITQIEQVIENGNAPAEAGGEVPAAEPAAPEPEEVTAEVPPTEEDKVEAEVEAPAPASPSSPADSNSVSPEAQAAAKARSDSKTPEFLRVQMSVLEDLINMVSELVLTRNQLLQLIRMEEDSAAAPPLQRLNRIVSDLQEGVMKTRMQPIGNAWSKLPRIVRDLTMELGKEINLEMHGEETELDRQVLEMIKDPLTHMVRNSCDHGVESREARKAAGKPETGTIKLEAMHEGGFIIIRISDDGKGLDARRIGEKALEKGLLDKERLDNMSDKQLLQCIFKAGFSTAEVVTNVSGRGVGMDVVRTNIEKIGGTIDMESTLGKGTVFTIQIPLTLAIISALIVEIDKARYAIPQLNIQELVRIDSSAHDKIEQINGRPVFRLRDRILPLIDSNALFGATPANDLSPKPPEKKSGKTEESSDEAGDGDEISEGSEIANKLIAVISAGSSSFGLVVDAIYGMEEIVIKSLSSILQDTHIFSGNTILGDGQVVMILDPAGIARRFEVRSDTASAESSLSSMENHSKSREKEKATMLVFKAGSETPKAIPLPLISRLQQFDIKDVTESGDRLVVKYNGTLMPLHFAEPEGQKLETDEVTTLILSDDVSHASLGLIIESIVDIMEDFLDLTTATARPGVIGSVTMSGTTVDVIDVAHYLSQGKEGWFAVNEHHGVPFVGANDQNESDQTSVLIVDDSPFFRNMLKPILTSAGFDVTVSEDALAAIKLHDRGKMFDVILSDIEMPEMTGYEFVEKMRGAESAWKKLPFIAITSHTTPQDVEHGYEKGFTKYIGKFDKDELIRTLDAVLSTRHSNSASA